MKFVKEGDHFKTTVYPQLNEFE